MPGLHEPCPGTSSDFAAPRRRLRRTGTLDTHDRTPSRLRHRNHATVVRIALAGVGDRPGRVRPGGPGKRRPPRRRPKPTPVTPTPGAPPAPGQPVVEALGQQSGSRLRHLPPPVGTPTVPRDPEPPFTARGIRRDAFGLPQRCLASGPGPVRIHRYGRPGDMPAMSPPPPGAGPAPQLPTRIHLVERPRSPTARRRQPTHGGAALPPARVTTR